MTKTQHNGQRWLWGVLLFLCMASCTCEQTWLPPNSQHSKCDLSQHPKLLRSAHWGATFGGSRQQAWGCLQVAWNQGEDARATLVSIKHTNDRFRIFAPTKEVAPSLTLPSTARAKSRRFHLFVFLPRLTQKQAVQRCEGRMATANYHCAEDPQTCWFYIAFKPALSNHVEPIDHDTDISCKLVTGPMSSKPIEPSTDTRELPDQQFELLLEPQPIPDNTCAPGEVRVCYSGPKKTLNQGVCHAGGQQCLLTGHWGKCQSESLPSKEVCDGKDNNCDGQIDEVCCQLSDVLLLVDHSCSMGTSRKWQSAKDAIHQLLTTKLRFGLIAFANNPHLLVSLGPNTAAKVKLALSNLSPSGYTNLPSAFQRVFSYYQNDAIPKDPIKGRHRFVVLFTDTNRPVQGATTGVARLRNISHKDNVYDVKTFVLGFGGDTNRALLQEMAQVGGTNRYYQADNSSLQQALQDIADKTKPDICPAGKSCFRGACQ